MSKVVDATLTALSSASAADLAAAVRAKRAAAGEKIAAHRTISSGGSLTNKGVSFGAAAAMARCQHPWPA